MSNIIGQKFEIRRLNASAISLQSDSCKFQEDFRANVSRDGENLYRMIRQWLMVIQPEQCTCNVNLIWYIWILSVLKRVRVYSRRERKSPEKGNQLINDYIRYIFHYAEIPRMYVQKAT